MEECDAASSESRARPDGQAHTAGPPRPLAPAAARRRWLVLLLALFTGPLLAELGLRWLLFGEGELARGLGEGLRKPALFARAKADDRMWILRNLFDPELLEDYEQRLPLDPVTGWRNAWLAPPDYRHPLLDLIGERRPTPFYGASFVREDFAADLHRRPLGERFALLPFGVGGFGLAQTLALMGESLHHFEGLEPLVLVGLQLQADPHRATLGFRAAAKPRARLTPDGRVELDPFTPAHTRAHVDEHPVGIRSYVLAWLLGPASPLPWVRARQARELEADLDRAFAINRAIVLQMRERVEGIGGELAMVLFHEPSALGEDHPTEDARREAEFRAFLAEREIRFVDTASLLRREVAAGAELLDFYQGIQTAAGLHPSAAGYDLFLEGIEQLLRGATDAR